LLSLYFKIKSNFARNKSVFFKSDLAVNIDINNLVLNFDRKLAFKFIFPIILGFAILFCKINKFIFKNIKIVNKPYLKVGEKGKSFFINIRIIELIL